MKKKRFVFEVAIEDFPYDEESFHLLGDNFLPDLPPQTYAETILTDAIHEATCKKLEDALHSIRKEYGESIVAARQEESETLEKANKSVKLIRVEAIEAIEEND